jgi:ribosome maturation factor RimP
LITKESVKKVIEEAIIETEIFLVDLNVTSGNAIIVEVDAPSGVNIKDCLKVSRAIEGTFDRDIEDYSLEVASPGAEKPFKVPQQYAKNVGRDVEVMLAEGKPISGTLIEVTDTGIVTEKLVKIKPEGQKKKVEVTERNEISFEDIKSTKIIIKF